MSLRWWISILVFMVVDTSTNYNNENQIKGANATMPKPRGTIVTIETEDGEVIDCVDVYKQPAFSNPLLKNHTLQMRPSILPPGMRLQDDESFAILQNESWSCPQGTVPIPRSSFKFPSINNPNPEPTQPEKHTSAAVRYKNDRAEIVAISGLMSIWKPTLESITDYSIAKISVVNNVGGEPVESIEAGWMVNSENDLYPQLFIYYTCQIDDYVTSCYNFDCDGFVITSGGRNQFGVPGRRFRYSLHNGQQIERGIGIGKDPTTDNWWFFYESFAVGYWPAALFRRLHTGGNIAEWGGEVIEAPIPGRAGTDQMGSGCFATDGPGRAAYMKEVYYHDLRRVQLVPDPVEYIVDDATRYTITALQVTPETGPFFYYGGPGTRPRVGCEPQ